MHGCVMCEWFGAMWKEPVLANVELIPLHLPAENKETQGQPQRDLFFVCVPSAVVNVGIVLHPLLILNTML